MILSDSFLRLSVGPREPIPVLKFKLKLLGDTENWKVADELDKLPGTITSYYPGAKEFVITLKGSPEENPRSRFLYNKASFDSNLKLLREMIGKMEEKGWLRVISWGGI